MGNHHSVLLEIKPNVAITLELITDLRQQVNQQFAINRRLSLV